MHFLLFVSNRCDGIESDRPAFYSCVLAFGSIEGSLFNDFFLDFKDFLINFFDLFKDVTECGFIPGFCLNLQ